MSSLHVLLPTAPVTGSSEFACVLSADGRTPGAATRTVASLLPAATGAGAQVVAIVPSSMLAWHRVSWPRGVAANSPRLRAALEGLLEEQLLDEPEALHFALDPQARPGDDAWVAVCDRAWLRACVQALEAAGRSPTRIVPEFAPEEPQALHVVGTAQSAATAPANTGSDGPIVPPAGDDPQGAGTWLVAHGPEGVRTLPLTPGAVDLLPPLADDTLCFAEPAVSGRAQQLLQRPLVLQPAAQRWLQAAQSRWDLAQFDFASTGRARALKKLTTTLGEWLHAPRWRPARWALAVLLLVNMVGLNAWAWMERSALAAKRDAVRATLTQAFPQVRVVVDAPVQMEREVAALRQATGAPSPRDMEVLLAALAQVAAGRSIAGLDYAAGELRARGLGWTDTDLRGATPALRSLGITASLQGDAVVLRAEGMR